MTRTRYRAGIGRFLFGLILFSLLPLLGPPQAYAQDEDCPECAALEARALQYEDEVRAAYINLSGAGIEARWSWGDMIHSRTTADGQSTSNAYEEARDALKAAALKFESTLYQAFATYKKLVQCLKDCCKRKRACPAPSGGVGIPGTPGADSPPGPTGGGKTGTGEGAPGGGTTPGGTGTAKPAGSQPQPPQTQPAGEPGLTPAGAGLPAPQKDCPTAEDCERLHQAWLKAKEDYDRKQGEYYAASERLTNAAAALTRASLTARATTRPTRVEDDPALLKADNELKAADQAYEKAKKAVEDAAKTEEQTYKAWRACLERLRKCQRNTAATAVGTPAGPANKVGGATGSTATGGSGQPTTGGGTGAAGSSVGVKAGAAPPPTTDYGPEDDDMLDPLQAAADHYYQYGEWPEEPKYDSTLKPVPPRNGYPEFGPVDPKDQSMFSDDGDDEMNQRTFIGFMPPSRAIPRAKNPSESSAAGWQPAANSPWLGSLFHPVSLRTTDTLAPGTVGQPGAALQPQARGARASGVRFTLVSNGKAGPGAFELQAHDPTGKLKRIRMPAGVVLQPLKQGAGKPAAGSPGGRILTRQLDAFCLDFAKLPPEPGRLYRIAPPAVQEKYKPLRGVLQAGRKLAAAGQLHPDTDPQAYATFIRQFALWSKLENWDLQKFTDAFLAQAKKNADGMSVKWSKEMESALLRAAPGRWRDISLVLEESRKSAETSAPGAARPAQ